MTLMQVAQPRVCSDWDCFIDSNDICRKFMYEDWYTKFRQVEDEREERRALEEDALFKCRQGTPQTDQDLDNLYLSFDAAMVGWQDQRKLMKLRKSGVFNEELEQRQQEFLLIRKKLPSWRWQARNRMREREEEERLGSAYYGSKAPEHHECSPFKETPLLEPTIHPAYEVFMDWRALKIEEAKDKEIFQHMEETERARQKSKYEKVLEEINEWGKQVIIQ